MSAQWKMTGVSLSYYACYCHCCILGNRRQALNTDLKYLLTFPGWFQPRATSVFLLRVKQFKTPLCTFPGTPHFPPAPTPAPQYSACFCLGHWHPKMFPLCYCGVNKTASGTVTERVGRPSSSISLSLLLQAVQLWLQLACAVHLYTVSVVPWPPSLDGVLRNVYYDANTG